MKALFFLLAIVILPARAFGAVPGPVGLDNGSGTGKQLSPPFDAAACLKEVEGPGTNDGRAFTCKQLVALAAPAPPAPAPQLDPIVDTSKIPSAVPGSSDLRVRPTTEQAKASDSGAFRTSCAYSHMNFDDPIVYPGVPGASHLHTFFGNSGTASATTPEKLRTTGTSSCRGGIVNRSAYWVPAMIDTKTHAPIKPDSIQVYYKFAGYTGHTPEQTRPIPVGLRMLAGNPKGTGPRTDAEAFSYRWKCIGGPNKSNDHYGSEIPDCDAGAQVWQEIFFPACWDGQNLDSPDHKSHMSYAKQQQHAPFLWLCPASHPVLLPGVGFNVIYTVPAAHAAKAWRLASDMYDAAKPGGYSSHGDWFNGWKEDVSDAWAKGCVQAKKDCHSHLLGDGREIY
jgi:hypothetical protein